MISWMAQNKKRYALCASETEALLAEVHSGKKGPCSVRSLSSSSRVHGDEIAVNRLLAGTARKQAQVALVFPLSSFEIVSVTVPAVNRQAVAKLLPYRLSKILDNPLTSYIYDWQVVQSFSERQELTVYLYPVAMFKKLQQDLYRRQAELLWFEADVFSACSYLELSNVIQEGETILCILVWKSSISMAVYEQGRITLVRSVDLQFPLEPYRDEELAGDMAIKVDQYSEQESDDMGESLAPPKEETHLPEVEVIDQLEQDQTEQDQPGKFSDEEALLAEFFLSPDNDGPYHSTSMREDENGKTGPSGDGEWQGYLRAINLEIMRTNDYYVSVLKGKPLNKIFVGGADFFYSRLEQLIQANMSVQVALFPPQKVDADCDQNLAALCIGALRR